jgi:hypothetical protein
VQHARQLVGFEDRGPGYGRFGFAHGRILRRGRNPGAKSCCSHSTV